MDCSILISCRNAAPYLANCLSSALDQGAKEILFVDDASDDGSREVALQFEGVTVLPVVPVRQGSTYWRSQLGKLASGQWIQILDADDYLQPGKIEGQISQGLGAEVLYSDYLIQRADGTERLVKTGELPLIRSLLRWQAWPQTNAFLFRRSAFLKIDWAQIPVGIQEAAWTWQLLKAGVSFRHVAAPHSIYRHWGSHQEVETPVQLMARRQALQEEIFSWAQSWGQYKEDVAIGRRRLALELSTLVL